VQRRFTFSSATVPASPCQSGRLDNLPDRTCAILRHRRRPIEVLSELIVSLGYLLLAIGSGAVLSDRIAMQASRMRHASFKVMFARFCRASQSARNLPCTRAL
jgi:hypothetical protein